MNAILDVPRLPPLILNRIDAPVYIFIIHMSRPTYSFKQSKHRNVKYDQTEKGGLETRLLFFRVGGGNHTERMLI